MTPLLASILAQTTQAATKAATQAASQAVAGGGAQWAAEALVSMYGKSQLMLAAAMLTVGGAAWAGLNFIWKLKEATYDRDDYLAAVAELKDVDPDLKSLGGFDQLRRLDIGLAVCGFLAAILQMTLGFVLTWWSSLICFVVAIGILVAALRVLYLIHRTSTHTVEIAEQEAQRGVEKIRAARGAVL